MSAAESSLWYPICRVVETEYTTSTGWFVCFLLSRYWIPHVKLEQRSVIDNNYSDVSLSLSLSRTHTSHELSNRTRWYIWETRNQICIIGSKWERERERLWPPPNPNSSWPRDSRFPESHSTLNGNRKKKGRQRINTLLLQRKKRKIWNSSTSECWCCGFLLFPNACTSSKEEEGQN